MPIQQLKSFSVSSIASGTTVGQVLIPPFPGMSDVPYRYNAQDPYTPTIGNNPAAAIKANWLSAPNFGVTHISSIHLNTPSTSHVLLVLRPLNWTYFPAGLAKNTTAIPDSAATGILDDPGIYTTNYRYPTGGGLFPAGPANAAISSTNKLVAYQLADGSWRVDTIASGTFGSTLTLTTGTPNTAGGAILAGAPLFYFGAVAGTLVDPATGTPNGWGLNTLVSVRDNLQDYLVGEVGGIHPGDPLVIYDANATAADNIIANGYYGDR